MSTSLKCASARVGGERHCRRKEALFFLNTQNTYIQMLMCCSTKQKMPLYHYEVRILCSIYTHRYGSLHFRALLCSNWAFKVSTPFLPGGTLWFPTNALTKLRMDWIIFLPILHHNSFGNLSLNSSKQVLSAFKNSIKVVRKTWAGFLMKE